MGERTPQLTVKPSPTLQAEGGKWRHRREAHGLWSGGRSHRKSTHMARWLHLDPTRMQAASAPAHLAALWSGRDLSARASTPDVSCSLCFQFHRFSSALQPVPAGRRRSRGCTRVADGGGTPRRPLLGLRRRCYTGEPPTKQTSQTRFPMFRFHVDDMQSKHQGPDISPCPCVAYSDQPRRTGPGRDRFTVSPSRGAPVPLHCLRGYGFHMWTRQCEAVS